MSRPILVAIAFASLLTLAGCASQSARTTQDAPAPHGVAIGTVTLGDKAEPLTYVYVRAPEAKHESDKTRVVLTNKPLSAKDLAELQAGTWTGGDRIRGALVDFGADAEWDAQFIEPSGLTGRYGITSSGGKVGAADGRVWGRIAVSNQNESGMRSLRASFNAALDGESASDASSARALAGTWRIARWIGDKGQVHSGDLVFTKTSGGIVARARIATAGTSYVADELFEVEPSATSVRLFGVVDPDAHWVADDIVLALDATGNQLSGRAKDVGGETTEDVQFVRVH